MVKVIQGVNDLATTHPELAKEAHRWHARQDSNLQPADWKGESSSPFLFHLCEQMSNAKIRLIIECSSYIQL